MHNRSPAVVTVLLIFIIMSVLPVVHAYVHNHTHDHADHNRSCPDCLALTCSEDSQALANPLICVARVATTLCIPACNACSDLSDAVTRESIRAPPYFIS
ncbi:MAG: hypothetical protein CBC79_06140 [Gammaproteobacteria bacterium TMED119]|nr:MAG: hypothetical protein CBC79_06140 [Gammaproteobacteria bacterium TMED119]